MPADNATTELVTYPNEMEAQMAAQLLRENGVGAYVKPLGFGYGGVGMIQFIPHQVLVYRRNVDAAREILGVDADVDADDACAGE